MNDGTFLKSKITALRMSRQFITRNADEKEYELLFRDMQPGYNVYWNGFGQPPTLSFRTKFDDIEFNAKRIFERKLIKGRFCGGNLGWIEQQDIELFASLYRKPIVEFTIPQLRILNLINQMGALNIRQIKEETGYLVKEITPILHRLQEAFIVYEDQYDGEWDRGWIMFPEMFPNVDIEKYSRNEALKKLICRFAYRNVLINANTVKSFYKLPMKEIKNAVDELVAERILKEFCGGYVLKDDIEAIENVVPQKIGFTIALHRNDFLVKSFEHELKDKFKAMTDKLPYDHDVLQYLLTDGEFCGVCVGHFRNGPYDLNDVVCDLPNAVQRQDEIMNAVATVNFGKKPMRFMGEKL